MRKVITAEINAIKFKPVSGIKYRNDYVKIYESIATTGEYNGHSESTVYRNLVKTDLFFILYFVLGAPCNKKFIVKACREIEDGLKTYTLDIWGREHYKSTILTKAEPIQMILKDPNVRIGIFSHTRATAKVFLTGIKSVLETNTFLHDLFPDVLYRKPQTQAPQWSKDEGLIVKRTTTANEATIEACGLVEGMPTGRHFTHRIYDDIVVPEIVRSPELMIKLVEAFEMSDNLGTVDGTHRVIGTYYHHADLLVDLTFLKDADGNSKYHLRLKPTLEGGDWNGKPVLLPAKRIADLKLKPDMFKTQHLLNPTPKGTQKFNSEYLYDIDEKMIPNNVQKFMIVDPAGSKGKGDAYAIMVFGVEPTIDEIGASRVFLLDASIEPLEHSQAIETVVRMYINAGIVQKLGVEKVGQSTAEIHIVAALKARGRHVSVTNKNLIILAPAGRNKIDRIESTLIWPLNNGKLFVSSAVSDNARIRIKTEMEKFPYWHDDGLDCWSYLYDILKDCTFMNIHDTLKIMESFSNRNKVQDSVAGY